MNRKSIIISLIALAVLIAFVAIAVFFLYSGKSFAWKKGVDQSEVSAISNFKLLPAVPSDAAALMTFPSFSDGVGLLVDSTKVFGNFIDNEGDNSFVSFISIVSKMLAKDDFPTLKDKPMLVSMHYNGDLIPLLILGTADSSEDSSEVERFMSAADSSHLHSLYVDCKVSSDEGSPLHDSRLVLVSPSETVINSSRRHISGGHSILDNGGFSNVAAGIGGDEVLFLSNENADKLLGRLLSSHYGGKYYDFFRNFSEWTAFKVVDVSDKRLKMKGMAFSAPDPSFFLNVFRDVEGSAPMVQDVLPATTVFSVSMPFDNVGKYVDSYKKYLDASGNMDKFRNVSAKMSDKAGITPERWAVLSGIKEVDFTTFRDKQSLHSVLLLRESGNKLPFSQVNKYQGFAAVVFGKLFSLDDESACAEKYGWTIIGSRSDVQSFISASAPKTRLKSLLDDADIHSECNVGNCTLFSYFSLTEFPQLLPKVFSPYMLTGLHRSLSGISYSPVVLTIAKESGEIDLNLNVSRTEVTRTAAQEVDNSVIVPKGPFKVRNTGDDRIYSLAQQDNGYITLSDDKGKGIWGIPFSGRMCGAVSSIDYYATNKYQYLFASGSKLYLLDKLGRFVKPFPVDLGKEILIGPEAYDFSGAHGYSVAVLHKDNTIGIYDLHGKSPASWKGITSKEKIKGLPELIRSGNKKYWVVRTSVQTLIFDFNGGEPLTGWTGGKMIRPDSKMEINGSSIGVTCYDGKKRNFKLK